MSAEVDLRDRFLGCLVGGAVGDALGAPFEGLWAASIPAEEDLLRGFAEFEGYPAGQYTDDTQLTMATIESIVQERELSPSAVAAAIAGLWKNQTVIGPGGACTRAATNFLRHRDWRTCGAPVGQAGNGTAMRTAAVGLYFLSEPEQLPAAVADVSRITHQDPRSVAGGVAVAKAAQLLATGQAKDDVVFCEEIARAMAAYCHEFGDLVRGLPALVIRDTETALGLIAWSGRSNPEFAVPIITPFVIPTVLASLWCLLHHRETWSASVSAAIRLGGDVDTLGAIVGSLAGIRHGVSGIPPHLADAVLHASKLKSLAARYHALVMARP